ncbi:MAG: hypothetical protein PHN84_10355 [Desulfuromonadaceae bacterium]|nr:hypothetical protein [Desulfuromonadaceae bacterium]MDD2854561.1 hypothetical protein [Desulfuromonadaceae bacterium]
MVKYQKGHSFWLFFATTLTLALIWLALMPGKSAPVGLGSDRLNHAAAIATVTYVVFLALNPRKRAAEYSFVYGIALGILIEIMQGTLTKTRSAEWADLVADIVGAAVVLVLIKIYQLAISPKA